MSQHSAGPWEVSATGRIFVVPVRNFERVAEVETTGRPWEVCVANARLMAAAPELLAACKMVLDDPGLTASANDVLRAAIAKAEGGAP